MFKIDSTLQPTATVSSSVEQKLRVALAIQQAMLAAAADGIVVTDERGQITAVNLRFVEMWGVPPHVHAAVDFSVWAAWGARQCREPAASADHYRAATQSAVPHSALMRLTDGRVFEQRSHPQLVDGRVAGRVWCYRDVSDRTGAQAEGRGHVGQALHGKKFESLSVLAGGIAHDFNNLLVGILGHAGIALLEMPPDSPLFSCVEQIQTAAQRAAELVSQVLAYSGKGQSIACQCDLSAIAAEVMTRLPAAAAGIEIDLRVRPCLPAVEGDPAQMRQVVMNLMSNAADAVAGRPGRIILTTGSMQADAGYLADAPIRHDASPGEFVFVEVHDTGCGMDRATLGRLFEPFFTTKFTGRGLGLAAVLGIVRRHHGAIKIASALGEGTTIRVLLPVSRAAAHSSQTSTLPTSPTAPTVPAAPRSQTPAAVSQGARVLVVDDEQPVLRVASEMLKRAGYTVATAGGGEQALALASQPGVAFDVVLMDMTMPTMNGAETSKQLRLLHPGLPVVLMSGYTSEEAVSRFGEGGLSGFVQKPFMPAALVSTIAEALARRDDGGGRDGDGELA
jgi:signal transduction histidine kinase/CheY-like chemotaxis protein